MSDKVRWVRALADDELLEGEVLHVEIEGQDVLLVRLIDGPAKAFQGKCPHQGSLLADGDWDMDSNTLVCPSHLWEFDLTDGRGINPENCRLREYLVRLKDKSLDVAIPTDAD
ncbi:Rieske 2Fe-2S domain-containing protein [Streptomyces sp. AK02-04a]|uniref:Rieske 2Fe-2S domain-containing protein n=1 Tax=Streptomyces sp. AK02-04a TaxID=3028649 RepID=UPI0029A61B90|nr:Rieske 2Fe-2S domain-containing protein [Streptomyces sp. AK02-04a]MDX3763657.1 Rieske 2Fe-2S domain-containing protein [Streptomyces sp. AK02-04a]